MFNALLFFTQIIFLYLINRITINQIYNFFKLFLKNEKTVFNLISLIFLPGTLIHEMSHFLAAIILFLRVREIKIFPEVENNQIRLGQVLFEKKDFIRGFLVGIAPLFAGLFFFFFISYLKLFPSNNIWLNLLLAYLIYSVSSVMFSSKQDLVDVFYLIPLMIVVVGIFYVFNIKLDFFFSNTLLIQNLLKIISDLNFYLSFSILFNLFLLITLKTIKKLFFLH